MNHKLIDVMQEGVHLLSQLKEARTELARVAEYESLYAREREEKLVVESVRALSLRASI